MLIGNVGKEPLIRYVAEGVCTASFTLATTTPGYTLPNGTQVPERTEWHNILLWREQAKTVERFVRKGDKLYVEGELRTRSYTDKNGNVRYITEVWGTRIEIFNYRNSEAAAQPETPQQPIESAASQPSADSDELPF